MPENPNAALKAHLQQMWDAHLAAKAARRAEAHARGEAVYPEPGFKASRLVEPEMLGDFEYLTDADVRRQRRRPAAGGVPDPREEEALERAAMAALKARRGCPAWVGTRYVDVLRRQGAWWKDIPL